MDHCNLSPRYRFMTAASFLLVLLLGCSSANNMSHMGEQNVLNPQSAMNHSNEELIATGREHLSKGNHPIAKIHFLMALNKNPNSVEAFIALGDMELANGNKPEAMKYFQKASQIDADNVDALLGQAKVFRQQGQLEQSIEVINQAMSKDPENMQVIMELATIYDLMGQEALSKPLYQEIIRKAPNSAAGYNNLGLNQIIKEQYGEAIISFSRAMNLQPDNDRIKNNLATAYLLYGDELNALHIFKETVGEAAAYNNIGYLYMTQNRLNEAEKAFRTALSLNPKFYDRAEENLNRLKQLRMKNQLMNND